MRPRKTLTHLLTALLVLRVLAAPVAARPGAAKPSGHHFVVRVCAWPAQRPVRVTFVAPTVPTPCAPGVAALLRGAEADAAGLAARARFTLAPRPVPSAFHLSDRPRC